MGADPRRSANGGLVASYHAISAVGEAILGLLGEARPRDEFPNADFELYQAKGFQSPMEMGVSLYLFRVVVNRARRIHPTRLAPDGTRRRPPLPLDLYYLLTPWAGTAAKQHQLLGYCMRTLEDTPVLPPGLLRRYGPDTFGPDEAVEIVAETLSLQDITNLWEVAKQHIQISVAYVARVVSIDSSITENVPPLVQTREIGAGVIVEDP